jgi:hypothetical protein
MYSCVVIGMTLVGSSLGPIDPSPDAGAMIGQIIHMGRLNAVHTEERDEPFFTARRMDRSSEDPTKPLRQPPAGENICLQYL